MANANERSKRLRYVNEFKDRHGMVRRYFRPPGRHSSVPLPGEPGSRQFVQAYKAAMDTYRTQQLPQRRRARRNAIRAELGLEPVR